MSLPTLLKSYENQRKNVMMIFEAIEDTEKMREYLDVPSPVIQSIDSIKLLCRNLTHCPISGDYIQNLKNSVITDRGIGYYRHQFNDEMKKTNPKCKVHNCPLRLFTVTQLHADPSEVLFQKQESPARRSRSRSPPPSPPRSRFNAEMHQRPPYFSMFPQNYFYNPNGYPEQRMPMEYGMFPYPHAPPIMHPPPNPAPYVPKRRRDL